MRGRLLVFVLHMQQHHAVHLQALGGGTAVKPHRAQAHRPSIADGPVVGLHKPIGAIAGARGALHPAQHLLAAAALQGTEHMAE